MSGRYGNFVGADEAAEVLETGMGSNGWDEPVRQEEVMRADFVEMAGRLRGRCARRGRRARAPPQARALQNPLTAPARISTLLVSLPQATARCYEADAGRLISMALLRPRR